VQRSQPANGTVLSSTATLADCQTSCGNLSFEYSFGIGSGCFRSQDFELICDNHSSSQHPRLFLHDGFTEDIYDITTDGSTEIVVSFSHSISLRSQVDVYSMSWNLGTSFSFDVFQLNFTGCEFDVYVLEFDTNNTVGQCSVTCPNEGITGRVARQNCNGTGCCSIDVGSGTGGFNIKIVRHKMGKLKVEAHNNPNSIWDTIVVASDEAYFKWVSSLINPSQLAPCSS
jgi:hypothetical protein